MDAATVKPLNIAAGFPPIRLRWPWHFIVFAIVVLMVATPLVFLVLGSFSTAKLPSDFSIFNLTFKNYVKVWSDPGTYAVFSNTVVFATGSTAVGIVIAAGLAWLSERTNLPFKIWIYAGIPMTLAMPGMLQAMAWVLVASPRVGIANRILMETFGLQTAPLNIYSLSGMVFVEGLRMVPTAFLMLLPLVRNMDPTLEEAAATSGANPFSVIRRVTIGLMLPGLIAVTIYQFTNALEGFEIPGILGLPSGTYVFSTRIYTVLHTAMSLPAYGEANALAMLYLFLAVISTALYGRVVAKSERYSIITGKGYRPKVTSLGRWRWPAFALVQLYLALAVFIPFIVLVYISLLPFLQIPSAQAFASMSWKNYVTVFHTEHLGKMLWNTVVMTLSVATAVVVASFVISFVIVRTRFWGRRILDQLAFIPHAIPGMVMGLALLWIFLQIDKVYAGTFGSLGSLVVAFVIGYISYGTRVMNAAILQVHKDLEEAAKTSGAPEWRVMWRIFLPLLLPAFIGVWIWTLLHVVRAAGMPLILTDGSGESDVLATAIWGMWDEGNIELVGVLGTLMVLALFTVTIVVRLLGFSRSLHQQRRRAAAGLI